jgi:hypothetical protein
VDPLIKSQLLYQLSYRCIFGVGLIMPEVDGLSKPKVKKKHKDFDLSIER